MDTKIILTTLLFFSVAGNATAQSGIPDVKHINIGLIYPISTNGVQAKTYTNYFSLNAIAGLSRAETGLSLAGFANVVLDSASGLQIAGFANVVGRNNGVEIAGFGNFARRNSSGLQVAGFINASANAGTQAAGFINKAANADNQVSGFINIAKKVKGIQIAGFINIADSSDYPIAIFNFVKNGEKTIGVSTDETLTTLVSFRSGGRRLYGIAGLGYNHKGKRELTAWEAGLGAHLVSTERFRLNIEVVNVGLTDFKHGDWMKSSLRVLPAYRLGSRVEIFAGPSFNYLHARNGQGEDIVDHYLRSDRNSHCYYGLFFGATGGITISLTKK
jgi:hypothetical protein